MPTIADILIAKGNAAAAGAQNRGNIYADLIRNLSSIPGQVVQQAKADDVYKQHMALQQGQQQLQSQELQQGQQRLDAGARQQRESESLDKVWSDPSVYTSDGTINRDGLVQRLSAANMGHLVPLAIETADRLDESRAQLMQRRQALDESYRETLGKDALMIERAGNDPGFLHLIVADRAKSGVISPDQAEALLKADTPDAVASITSRWKAGSAAGKPKLMKLGPNEVAIDENNPSGPPIASGQKQRRTGVVNGQIVDLDTGDPIGKAIPQQETPAAAETARHNRELERIAGLTAGRTAAAEKETERHNLAMEASARNRTEARPVLSSDANRITDIDTGIKEADALSTEISGKTGTGSWIGANLPNFVTNATGLGTESKQRQAIIDRIRQLIGKTLEGGVLRKEDEIKYTKILPTIGDPPEVAATKIAGLREMLARKRETTLESLTDAGFNTGALVGRGAPAAPAAPAAPVAPALTPGLKSLMDR